MISQSIFNIASPVESALHQCLEPGLTGGAANRGNKSIPFGHDFRVWRQARNINEAFGFRNSLFVKGSDSHRKGFDEGVELCVRERPIDQFFLAFVLTTRIREPGLTTEATIIGRREPLHRLEYFHRLRTWRSGDKAPRRRECHAKQVGPSDQCKVQNRRSEKSGLYSLPTFEE